MNELEIKLRNLRQLRRGATDPEMVRTIDLDIHNVERALVVDEELRSPIGGPGRRVKVIPDAPAGETEAEFRTRAEKEVAAIPAV